MLFRNLNTLNLNDITYNEVFDRDQNKYTLKVMVKETLLAKAIYQIRLDGDIDFNWIETEPKYQRKGIANKMMDYLCNKAITMNKNLIINVVDEDILNSFYLKWFKNHANPNNHYDAYEVLDYFDTLVADKDSQYFNRNHPTLILTPENISWRPKKAVDQSLLNKYC